MCVGIEVCCLCCRYREAHNLFHIVWCLEVSVMKGLLGLPLSISAISLQLAQQKSHSIILPHGVFGSPGNDCMLHEHVMPPHVVGQLPHNCLQ